MIAMFCVAVSQLAVVGKLMKYLLQSDQHVVINCTFLLSKLAAGHIGIVSWGWICTYNNTVEDSINGDTLPSPPFRKPSIMQVWTKIHYVACIISTVSKILQGIIQNCHGIGVIAVLQPPIWGLQLCLGLLMPRLICLSISVGHKSAAPGHVWLI